MVDAVRLGGSVEAAPVTCMGVCVCTHGGTWVGTLPLTAVGEAVQRCARSEALAVWSGVDRTTYLTKAEIRHSFNVVHTAENH